MTTALSAAELLNSISLDELDKEIASLEAEIAALVSDKQKQLDCLKELRRFKDIQVNGKKTWSRKKKAAIPEEASTEATETPSTARATHSPQKLSNAPDDASNKELVQLALRQFGPMTVGELTRCISRTYGQVDHVLRRANEGEFVHGRDNKWSVAR